jgi:serine/alanine adding enzyme
MRIITCTESDGTRWEQFVDSHTACSRYHLWNWRHVFQNTFGWPSFYLAAEDHAGVFRGILPLVLSKTLFGAHLTSMPHLAGGGAVAESVEIAQALIGNAIEIAKQVKAKDLELRYTFDPHLDLPARSDKVNCVLCLRGSQDQVWNRFSSHLRNTLRKSMTFGMDAEFGGKKLLNDFYSVYSENMRDLGSPPYSRRFFSEILDAFPKQSHVCVVRHQGETVAAGFLTAFRDTVEANWSSASRRYLSLKPNMFLFWNLIRFACDQGYEVFDFGRSTIGSGPHKFKLQWGTESVPLHWRFWLRDGGPLRSSTSSSAMRLASRIWRRLPIPLTNYLGPQLIRYIPGV